MKAGFRMKQDTGDTGAGGGVTKVSDEELAALALKAQDSPEDVAAFLNASSDSTVSGIFFTGLRNGSTPKVEVKRGSAKD